MGRLAVVLMASALAACEGPAVDRLAPGAEAVVAEVRSGDAVALEGGRVVRLAGVAAPRGEEPYAEAARRALAALVQGRKVRLMYGGARQDAYGRILAHLKRTRDGAWVEAALLEAGAVRVRTYADNRALARAMLDAEARARLAGRGLWALPAYRVRLPGEAAARPFGFQVVEGRVAGVRRAGEGVRLDLERWIEAEIPEAARGAFVSAGVDPSALPGRLVRVRGVLRPARGGGRLRLDHPEQLEVLREPR